MQNLQEPKLKRTYCRLKALKTVMGVGISSYGLKNVLLLKDFSYLAKNIHDEYNILHTPLNHPYSKLVFQGHVSEVWNKL